MALSISYLTKRTAAFHSKNSQGTVNFELDYQKIRQSDCNTDLVWLIAITSLDEKGFLSYTVISLGKVIR